jgi:hypothetical protein
MIASSLPRLTYECWFLFLFERLESVLFSYYVVLMASFFLHCIVYAEEGHLPIYAGGIEYLSTCLDSLNSFLSVVHAKHRSMFKRLLSFSGCWIEIDAA